MRMKTEAPQAAVRFDPDWRSVLESSALEVFEMMAGARMGLNSKTDAEPSGELTAMVGMAGALCGIMTVRCSRETATKCASLMLGGDAVSNPSTVRDALGELCNMVAGNFKAKVANLADTCMLSVPTVISGEDYSMDAAEPTERVTVGLLFEGEPVWVTLVAHARS